MIAYAAYTTHCENHNHRSDVQAELLLHLYRLRAFQLVLAFIGYLSIIQIIMGKFNHLARHL